MSDNLRPMLYGSVYEAHVADRFGGSTECVLAGKQQYEPWPALPPSRLATCAS